MKAIHLFVIILSLGFAAASKTYFRRGVNGGLECAACTIVVGLLEQIAEIDSKNISDIVSNICDVFPTTYEKFCRIIVRLWGPIIIDKMVRKESSDVICYSVGMCHVDKGEEFCHLFPIPKEGMYPAIMKSQQASRTLQNILQLNFKNENSFCDHEVLQFMCDMIDRFLNQAKPLIDLDGDSYSTVQDWRGSSWRGKDCNDLIKHIHPGLRPADYDRDIDSNCNGIWGTNKITGEPYEKELCEGTNPRGLVYIGDSVGAHLHIPSQWFTAKEFLKKYFTHFEFILGNEFDWPETSFATGYKNLSWPTLQGYTDSLYFRLREHNLCNHRDYQNLAVNGADSEETIKYIKEISRNKTSLPVIAIYAMMANDICSGQVIL
ncbi:acyloxyacyl hydrolase-like isoform X1 [Centruroides vittatus]|uniref:acyloxyacyl hydrolase-like isoform X1 n=2 Tax=Centruroides vittatus TaxID=120091 RepID=UPI00350E92CA